MKPDGIEALSQSIFYLLYIFLVIFKTIDYKIKHA